MNFANEYAPILWPLRYAKPDTEVFERERHAPPRGAAKAPISVSMNKIKRKTE